MEMILTLIGLILSFGGSAYLVYDTLISLRKPKSVIIPVREGGKIIGVHRLKPTKEWGYKQVKVTPEEIKLVISLFIISLGFFLQILDFII